MLIKNTYIIGIFALIYVAIATLGLAWIMHRVVSLGEELETRIAIIEASSAKEKANKDLMVLLESTKNDRETIDGFILNEDTTSSFLTQIERIASAQGVTLTTNSLEVIKPVKKVVATSTTATTTVANNTDALFQQLTISFAVEGSEAGVKKMLQILEDIPYHSQITAFSLARKSVGTAKGTINMTITLLK